MIWVLFGLVLRYMKMIVFYSQLVPHAAQGAVFGLAVFKPDLPNVLATALDFNTDIVIVFGIHPVVNVGINPIQRASPPCLINLAGSCLFTLLYNLKKFFQTVHRRDICFF